MSSDGDLVAVQTSLNDNIADASSVHFSDKNYTFITDSTSNSGSFSSGQISFDLSTLSSQSQWINLSEAVIEFPVKITAKIATAGGSGGSAVAKACTTIIKNGFHQWIDSAQLIINGQTIQSSQPYENVAAQFRILSNWSQDTLKKWGPTCGVALDDCTGDSSMAIATNTGLSNAPLATVATDVRGFDAVNSQGTLFNKGVAARSTIINSDINPSAASLQTAILGAASMKTEGRCHVSSSAGSNTVGTSIYSAFYMATVRLKDLCDISDFPMVKNLKGFLYLSFNSARVNLTGTTASNGNISSVSVTPLTGRTTPFLINTDTASGLVPGSNTTTAQVIQITGSVDATTTDAVGSAGPLLTNARLLVPYYIANPKTDAALTNGQKFFTTMEKIVNPITVTAGSSINYTITSGVQNPRKLLLLPMWQKLGASSNPPSGPFVSPETSPFDTVPATSGPFAMLNNLQVYLANRPLYQYPIQYSFEQWVSENSQLGLNGNQVSEDTSGLLTQQLFEQNHRFYYVDLSRRTMAEDGASKSVQVSFTNPGLFDMKVIAIVFYEKQWIINTSQCQLQSV